MAVGVGESIAIALAIAMATMAMLLIGNGIRKEGQKRKQPTRWQ